MVRDITQLTKSYQIKKDEIQKRIKEFGEILNQSDERVFAELAFCICTPQSKATVCWDTINFLMKNDLLFTGTAEQIRPFLNLVRFPDKKAKYIVEARNFFTDDSKLRMKDKIKYFDNAFELRNWLVENVKGIGFKEASHFLRNVGLGKDLAILDVHVLKKLKEFKIIEGFKALTKKNYIEIENEMRKFSKQIKIPMNELDLLLWSEETGIIFK